MFSAITFTHLQLMAPIKYLDGTQIFLILTWK